MILMTVAEVAAVLGAATTGVGEVGARVLDVVTDSRDVRPGSLFVALPGEHVDGHSFVAAALEQGAVAALTERPLPVAGLCLAVADAVAAMGRLARHLVDSAAPHGLRVVAITGSSGKTSTKDLLAQILERVGPTVAPHGNLNNEIGVPLTASRIDADTAFLVVEMGARGIGQVAYLCELTPPRVGVVLNVGQAHVGEFGSQQAIARAKGELVEALDGAGVAVLNADDELVWGMRERSEAAVCAFSAHAEPAWPRAVWAEGLASDELGRYRFVLHTKSAHEREAEAPVELRLSGRHHVANAVAAAAAASALGVDLALIAGSLSNAQLRSSSRMEIHERSDDVIVINDAYNANPDSARAAVDALAELGRARRARQATATTWAILGDMLELGESSAEAHAGLGRYAIEAGIDRLIAVGEFAPALAAGAFAAGADDSAVLVTDKAAAAKQVIPYLKPGDIVLVKASRGLALDTVAEEIWTAPGPHQTAKSEDPA